MLFSLKLSSRNADCSLESLSFFLDRPFSSSSLALEDAFSVSTSFAAVASAFLLLPPPVKMEKSIRYEEAALFGEEAAVPLSLSSFEGW